MTTPTPSPYVTLMTERMDDRRGLDRSMPAAPDTSYDALGATHYVHTGDLFVRVSSAQEQAFMVAYHNLRNGHSTADECDRAMRVEAAS